MKTYLKVVSVFILSLLLTSCGSGDNLDTDNMKVDPEVGINGNSIMLKGQIEEWARANQTLTAYTSDASQPEAQVSIANNGTFDLTLNQPIDLSKGLQQTVACDANDPNTSQSDVSISNPTSYQLLKMVGDSAVLHLSSTKDYTGRLAVASGTTVTNVEFYYYDNASVVSGEEACVIGDSQQLKAIYDLDIKVGWNNIVYTISNQNGLLTISGKTGSVPDNVSWFARQ